MCTPAQRVQRRIAAATPRRRVTPAHVQRLRAAGSAVRLRRGGEAGEAVLMCDSDDDEIEVALVLDATAAADARRALAF